MGAHMARRASMCRAAFHPEPGAIGKMDLRALSASGIVSSREEHLAVEHFSSPGPVGLRVQARLVLCGALAIHGFHRAAMDSRLLLGESRGLAGQWPIPPRTSAA